MFNVTHIAVILLKLLSSQISKLCKMRISEKLVKIQKKKKKTPNKNKKQHNYNFNKDYIYAIL